MSPVMAIVGTLGDGDRDPRAILVCVCVARQGCGRGRLGRVAARARMVARSTTIVSRWSVRRVTRWTLMGLSRR
jgi:hypothetical protein